MTTTITPAPMLETPHHSDQPTLTIVGNFAVVITIKPDDDCDREYPFEDAEWGEIVHHARSIDKGFDPDRFAELVESKKDRDAVMLSAYNHGQWAWWAKGFGWAPDMQWDGCYNAGFFVPGKGLRAHCNARHWKIGSAERTAYMLKQAKTAAESFTTWLNGDYYGFTVNVFDVLRDEDDDVITDAAEYEHEVEVEHGSCWGYDDFAYCVTEAMSEAQGLLSKLDGAVTTTEN